MGKGELSTFWARDRFLTSAGARSGRKGVTEWISLWLECNICPDLMAATRQAEFIIKSVLRAKKRRLAKDAIFATNPTNLDIVCGFRVDHVNRCVTHAHTVLETLGW